MGRIIDRKDIRKGDKIVVKLTVEVGTDLDSDGDFKTSEGSWFEFDERFGYEVELLERAKPEVPTKKGAVVRVFNERGESAHWMVLANRDLVSQSNTSLTHAEFIELVAIPDIDFEVIA